MSQNGGTKMRGLAWIDETDESQLPASDWEYAPPTRAGGSRRTEQDAATLRREASDTIRDPQPLTLAEELESHVRRKPRIEVRPQLQLETVAAAPKPKSWAAQSARTRDADPIITRGARTGPSRRVQRSSRIRQAALFVFGMLTGLLIVVLGDPSDGLHEGRTRIAAALRALTHSQPEGAAALPAIQPVQGSILRAVPALPAARPTVPVVVPAPVRETAPPAPAVIIPTYDVSQLPLVHGELAAR